MLHDIIAQIVAHPISIPDSGIQEALDAVRPALADCFGELPAILPFHPVKETNEVPSGPFTHFHPPEPMGDAPHQVVQGL